ncbi:MAG: alpha-galactosidase [Clostridia bacterium]|nr:alpha-galactosidase [Clostridia bacterium]
MFFDMQAERASFCHNGEKIALIPEQMTAAGEGVYEKTLPDGLTAILEIETFGENAFYQLLRFEHRGEENSGIVSCVRSLDLSLPADGDPVWESIKGDSCGKESFNPLKKTFAPGDTLHVEPKFGRPSDTDGFPYFDLALSGSAATFGIGWSGQWVLELERTQTELRLRAGLAVAETFLYPGEGFRAASVLCASAEDISASRRAFRRLTFDRFSPHTENGEYVTLPIAEQNFDRYFGKLEEWATVAGQKKCADIAVRCHMDALWLDAGWFKDGFPAGVGNYSFAPGFPDGLAEVGEYAHEKGLRFIQWFEPERVNCYSETYRDHADEVIVLESKGSVNCLLNIGEERVRRRLTELLCDMIKAHHLDIYRQDFNICPSGYWDTEDKKHPGRRGMTEIRFVEGHYKMWDEIRARLPGLVIDNCASGGRRLDVETTRRAVPLWRSDTGCNPATQEHPNDLWSQNHILALTRYLPYHSNGSWSARPYDIRSTFSGGIEINLDVLSPDFDHDPVVPVVEECRRLRRYWHGDFYPLTVPDNSDRIWAAWQLDLGGEGLIIGLRRTRCPFAEFSPTLSAIDPRARYEVTVTDEEMNAATNTTSGEELLRMKLYCPAPRTSVIVEYRVLR